MAILFEGDTSYVNNRKEHRVKETDVLLGRIVYRDAIGGYSYKQVHSNCVLGIRGLRLIIVACQHFQEQDMKS